MPHESITYRRVDLYELVWSEPMLALAKREGISDVALGKICRRLAVPLPGKGRWARVAAGQQVPRTALPELRPGARDELTVRRWKPEPGALVARASTPARKLKARTEAVLLPPGFPVEPHDLVVRARKHLTDRKPGHDGLVRKSTGSCLSVCVAPASLDRALQLMDAVLKRSEARGHRVELHLPPAKEPTPGRLVYSPKPEPPECVTRVLIDGEWIVLHLVERCRVERDPTPTPPKGLRAGWELNSWIRNNRPPKRFIPTGVLELSLSAYAGRLAWRDHRRTKLESRLDDVIAGLEASANQAAQKRAEDERKRQEWMEHEQRRREAEQRQWEDKKQLEEVQAKIARWRLASDLRAYVAEATRMVEEAGCTIRPESSLSQLVAWATDYADRIDPFSPLRRELKAHVEKIANLPEGKELAERRQRRELERARLDALLQRLDDSRRASEIRTHVAANHAAVADAGAELEPACELGQLLHWSLEYADRLDPIAALRREVASFAASTKNPMT